MANLKIRDLKKCLNEGNKQLKLAKELEIKVAKWHAQFHGAAKQSQELKKMHHVVTDVPHAGWARKKLRTDARIPVCDVGIQDNWTEKFKLNHSCHKHHVLKQQLSKTDRITEDLNSFYLCRFVCVKFHLVIGPNTFPWDNYNTTITFKQSMKYLCVCIAHPHS